MGHHRWALVLAQPRAVVTAEIITAAASVDIDAWIQLSERFHTLRMEPYSQQ